MKEYRHPRRSYSLTEQVEQIVYLWGAWWLSDKFCALHPRGRRFEPHSSRHEETLGKSFTRSCLYNALSFSFRMTYWVIGGFRSGPELLSEIMKTTLLAIPCDKPVKVSGPKWSSSGGSRHSAREPHHMADILYPVIAVAAFVSFDIFNKRLLYCIVLYCRFRHSAGRREPI